MKNFCFFLLFSCCYFSQAIAQDPDEDQLGAWYMYFWNTNFGESNWGLQGDYQYRDWRGLGDRENYYLEQVLHLLLKNLVLNLRWVMQILPQGSMEPILIPRFQKTGSTRKHCLDKQYGKDYYLPTG